MGEKGLGELPAVRVKGMLTPLGAGMEQEVMGTLNKEVREVQALVRKKVLTDETEDIERTIAEATATFPRYNKDLLLSADKIKLLPLRPAPPRSGASTTPGRNTESRIGSDVSPPRARDTPTPISSTDEAAYCCPWLPHDLCRAP